jgi:tRNA(Ile)-lysidine synthase
MAQSRHRFQTSAAQLLQQDHLRPGERLGVAVSGGADSVALLLLLLELREKIGFVPCVVHFNHKLRGKASDADEKFVANLAKKHRLEFFSAHENIAAKAKREKINLEDAARRARYSFFDRLVQQGHIHRVAVAHTADDQAETVIAHILRGTGLAGLAGIHPEAGVVIRPLLATRRALLRSYLRAKRQTWREDATNRDTARNRARIRLKLMPLLEKQFQPAVVEHLCQLAEFAREDEAYLEAQVTNLIKAANSAKSVNATNLDNSANSTSSEDPRSVSRSGALSKHPHEQSVSLVEFLGQPESMQTRLIRRLVEPVKQRAGQLSAGHVQAVLRLAADQNSGKCLQLPGGVEVRRDRDALSFLPAPILHLTKQAHDSSHPNYSYPVDLRAGAADVPVVELSTVLRFRVIDWAGEGRETKDTGAFLDRNKLRFPLVVRNWLPGDVLRPVGHQKAHKLARLLSELGISRWDKASWPVVSDGEQVIWARGLPVAAEFAAGKATRAGVMIIEDRET